MRDAFEEIIMMAHDEFCRAILASDARLYGAAMFDIQQLHAIADAEDRHAKSHELFKINIRGVHIGRAAWAAREDDRSGVLQVNQFCRWIEMGNKTQLANAANDELAILGTVIEYGNFVVGHGDGGMD
jgi:hypothetical protein